MAEHNETIRILHYGDADYPEVMQYVSEKYDIVRVGNIDCVPLYQVIDRLQEPKCNYWHRDDETGEIQRDCEG